jgi:hypothetical protein
MHNKRVAKMALIGAAFVVIVPGWWIILMLRHTVPPQTALTIQHGELLDTQLVTPHKGESWLMVRIMEGNRLSCAAIRYRGFLAEITDLSEIRGLPRGTPMTLHTYDSNWFDSVGKLPDVWQIDTSSGTVLSYAQTTEAWRKHRKRGIIVFSIMASVIFLSFCSADLLSDRTARARNTPWPYRGR